MTASARVLAAVMTLIAVSSATFSVSASTVIDDSSLLMWLNADDIVGLSDGDSVNTWFDSSTVSSVNNATLSAGTPTYVADAGGGVSGVRFGAGAGMDTTATVSGGNYTIFALFNYESGVSAFSRAVQGGVGAGTENWLIGPYLNNWSHYADPWVSVNSDPLTRNTFAATAAVRDASGPSSGFFVNGVNTTDTGTPAGYPGTIGLGTAGQFNEALNGVLSEVLVYDRLLTPSETTQLNTYLANKVALLNAPITIASSNASSEYSPLPVFPSEKTHDGLTTDAFGTDYWLAENGTGPLPATIEYKLDLTDAPNGWSVDQFVLYNTTNDVHNDSGTNEFTIELSTDGGLTWGAPVVSSVLPWSVIPHGEFITAVDGVTDVRLTVLSHFGTARAGLNEFQVFGVATQIVPEPSSIALVVVSNIAMLGFGLVRRRNR